MTFLRPSLSQARYFAVKHLFHLLPSSLLPMAALIRKISVGSHLSVSLFSNFPTLENICPCLCALVSRSAYILAFKSQDDPG